MECEVVGSTPPASPNPTLAPSKVTLAITCTCVILGFPLDPQCFPLYNLTLDSRQDAVNGSKDHKSTILTGFRGSVGRYEEGAMKKVGNEP